MEKNWKIQNILRKISDQIINNFLQKNLLKNALPVQNQPILRYSNLGFKQFLKVDFKLVFLC